MKTYKVTRLFTSGLLKGETFTEISTVSMPVRAYENCIGGCDYVVLSCEEI